MSDGASNQSLPRPLTRIAVVTPLRAIAVTMLHPSMPCAASMIAFADAIDRLRKNCELAAMNASDSRTARGGAPGVGKRHRDRGQELKRGSRVAAVHLVAHQQRLRLDRS